MSSSSQMTLLIQECQKPPRDVRGGFLSQQEVSSCYPALWGNTVHSKPSPHSKNCSQQHHTKTTFCDYAVCYSGGITSPFLPSFPCLLYFFFFCWVPGAPERLGSIQDSTFRINNTVLTTAGQPYL